MARENLKDIRFDIHLYWTWSNMRKRCDYTEGKDAKNYVDRGISYDPSWKSFRKFYEDMGATYARGLSLDRIDNNKGYSVDNCRWATRTQQNNNTRANRKITIRGMTKTLSEWSKESKVKPSTVRQRYYVYGWEAEKALGFL